MSSESVIRPGARSDVPDLAEIYNYYVEHSHATYDLVRVSLDERMRWFVQFDLSGPHRLLVVERDGQIAGYATSSAFHPKPIYAHSVEIGVYVATESCHHGLGTQLYESLLGELENEPSVERLVAGITLPNEASVALQLKFGFEPVGTFHRVGDRDGSFFDLCWFDRPARLGV